MTKKPVKKKDGGKVTPPKPVKKTSEPKSDMKESTITQKEYQNYKKFKEQGSNMDSSVVTKEQYKDYKKLAEDEGFGYKKGGKVSAPKPAKKPVKEAQDYKDAKALEAALNSSGRAESGDKKLMKKYKKGGMVKKGKSC